MSDRNTPAYTDAPAPLTDQERRLVKRLFSDYYEVPPEWRASLRRDLENDPPILGKIVLGGSGTSQVPLEALASAGRIGQSGIQISQSAITLGGDVYLTRQSAGSLDILNSLITLGPSQDVYFQRVSASVIRLGANEVRIGRTNGPVALRAGTGGRFEIVDDEIRFGFTSQDVALLRYGVDSIEIPDVLLITYNAGANVLPLYVNENGTVYQVRVGGAGSGPGGSGRALFIN